MKCEKVRWGSSKILLSLPFRVIPRTYVQRNSFLILWLEKKNTRFFALLRMTSLMNNKKQKGAEILRWRSEWHRCVVPCHPEAVSRRISSFKNWEKMRFFTSFRMTSLMFSSSWGRKAEGSYVLICFKKKETMTGDSLPAVKWQKSKYYSSLCCKKW